MPAILCIAFDVRKEFEHWRRIRNVCAHYKDYCFVKAHTLTLYAFIRQNLLSITVEGGMMTLLEEFKVFFDPNKTPPTASWQPLMDKVSTMVMPGQMQEFLHGVRKLIPFYTDKLLSFLHELHQSDKTEVKESARRYINGDDDVRQAYISEYPQSVATLLTKDEAYEFAKTRVPSMNNSANVMAALIQTGAIDKENYKELFASLHEITFHHDSHIGDLTPVEMTILDKAGYFSLILERYLNADYMKDYSHYQKVNHGMRFWTSVFWNMPVNKEFVKAVCEVFSQQYKPLALENFIVDEYLKDKNVHDKFFETAKAEGYKVPSSFNG